jgi:DNA-binding MarR family transcriptional regulator
LLNGLCVHATGQTTWPYLSCKQIGSQMDYAPLKMHSVKIRFAMAAPKPLALIPALHRATHNVSVYIERNAALKVTQAEAHILSHLWAAGEATIAELHRAFGHKRSTLTSILDRLAERSLIHRDVSASDRRSFVVRLSATGKNFAEDSYRILQELETALAARLKPTEIEGFLSTTTVISSYGQATEPAHTGSDDVAAK